MLIEGSWIAQALSWRRNGSGDTGVITGKPLAELRISSGRRILPRPDWRDVRELQRCSQKMRTAQQVKARDESSLKVLIVDDHPVVRRGISSFLAQQAHLSIVGEAADGLDALRRARETLPDIVLIDIDMPRMNGLLATEALRKELPLTKVIVLSMCQDTENILRILKSGAHGYVLKGAGLEDVVRAIETVRRGETYFDSDVARQALTQMVRGPSGSPMASLLTSRERDVLSLIAEGFCNKEIASHLGIGVRTVETHREHLMRKLAIRSIAGLTKFAISRGLASCQTGSEPERSGALPL